MSKQAQHSPARTALVTGGRRGIGAAIVAEFEQRGISVMAPFREELDLSNAECVEQYLAAQGESHEPVDILVNNAGINVISSLEDISSESWQTMLPRRSYLVCESAAGGEL
jgi:NADP-dependent 3-hydroxy acid dehydrogenase YdfG